MIASGTLNSRIGSSNGAGFKLLLLDDHKLFSEGLANLLRTWSNVSEVDVANEVDFFFQKMKDKHYDLILLDMLLPDMHGLDVLRELTKRNKEVKVLIVSQNSNGKEILEAVRLGASGMIEKTARFSEVKTAIERVVSGNEYYAKDLLRHIGTRATLAIESSIPNPDNPNLTDRELAVLMCVCKQLSVEESSSTLDLSVSSVKKYRMSLLEKTKSKNNIGLLAFALKNSLISLDEI